MVYGSTTMKTAIALWIAAWWSDISNIQTTSLQLLIVIDSINISERVVFTIILFLREYRMRLGNNTNNEPLEVISRQVIREYRSLAEWGYS